LNNILINEKYIDLNKSYINITFFTEYDKNDNNFIFYFQSDLIKKFNLKINNVDIVNLNNFL